MRGVSLDMMILLFIPYLYTGITGTCCKLDCVILSLVYAFASTKVWIFFKIQDCVLMNCRYIVKSIRKILGIKKNACMGVSGVRGLSFILCVLLQGRYY